MRTVIAVLFISASLASGVTFARGNFPVIRPLKQAEPVAAPVTQAEVPKVVSWQRPL